MKCSICGNEIEININGWYAGNNAQPINSGRCCDECDVNVVLPKRLQLFEQKDEEKYCTVCGVLIDCEEDKCTDCEDKFYK